MVVKSVGKRLKKAVARVSSALLPSRPTGPPVFTEDWTTNKIDLWFPLLEEMKGRPISILEAGTFEGRTAIALLDYLPDARISCLDLFKAPGVEERFDHNLAPYGDRVTKLKGSAVDVLQQLRRKRKSFDVIYLDCAKVRMDAFIVSAMGWHLLKVGGIIMWDDLTWQKKRSPARRAEPGSKLFIRTFWDEMEVLHHPGADRRWRAQFIARKVSDGWPEYRLPAPARRASKRAGKRTGTKIPEPMPRDPSLS